MFSLIMIFGLTVVIGGVLTWVALGNAPDGYEDSEGFHLGKTQDAENVPEPSVGELSNGEDADRDPPGQTESFQI